MTENRSMFQQGNTWLSAARQRARQGFMQAIGSHTSSDDQEYDEKFKNFNLHAQELAKMKELMEIWIDSFDSFCKATSLVSEAWRQFHSSNPYLGEDDTEGNIVDQKNYPFSSVAAEVDNIALCVDERIRPAILSTLQAKCIKPVSSILSLVPQVQEHHQSRKLLLSEFDSYRVKMEKEFAAGRDSTHPNVIRRAAKLDESAKKLHAEHSLLLQKFHEFETARSQTLGPELGVFVSCLYCFSSLLHSEMSEVLPLIPQTATTLAALDYSKMNPSTSNPTHRFTKLTASYDSNYKHSRPVDVITARPAAAGGAVGGYGTVSAADSNYAAIEASLRMQQDEEAPSTAPVPGPVPCSEHWENWDTPFSGPDQEFDRPISDLSMASHAQSFQIPQPQDFSSDMQSDGQLNHLHAEEKEFILGSLSETTIGTGFSIGSENGAPDTAQPPPKPPRKVRPPSNSAGHSTIDHIETAREGDEDASTGRDGCVPLTNDASTLPRAIPSSSVAREILTGAISSHKSGISEEMNMKNPTDGIVEHSPPSAEDRVT